MILYITESGGCTGIATRPCGTDANQDLWLRCYNQAHSRDGQGWYTAKIWKHSSPDVVHCIANL